MTTRTEICQTVSPARPALGRAQAWTWRHIPRALLLGALLVGACDDAAEQRKPGPTPAVPAVEPPPSTSPSYEGKKPNKPAPSPDDLLPTTPTTPPDTTAKPPAAAPDIAAVVRTYSGCYTDCFTERASKTNRETCKLTCDAAAEATLEGMPGAPTKEQFKAATANFTGCVNACYEDKSLNATNRATCVLTCQDAAEVAAIGK